MPISFTTLLIAGVLIACGVYLILERTLTRIVLGLVLLGNGINLLFLMAIGVPGKPPFQGTGDASEMSDPLPMAMVLTAIVISLALTSFGVALAYRAWQLFGHDEVPDDVEDMRVRLRSQQRRLQMPGSPVRRAGHTVRSRADLVNAEAEYLAEENALDISDDLTSEEDAPDITTEADESTVQNVLIPPKQTGRDATGQER